MISLPTTTAVSDNIIAQLQTSLNQVIPLFPKAFNRVLAKALAGVFMLIYKYAGFIALQQLVQYAAIEDTEINGVRVSPLKSWGRLIGEPDPALAIPAELTITITVENQTGTLPAGTQLVNNDNGVIYLTSTAVVLNASTVTVDIVASSDQSGGDGAGVIGNLAIGEDVYFVNALANVNKLAEVTTVVITGTDAEPVDVYRQAIIDRFQKVPQGGAVVDYAVWGGEVADVVNIYPYAGVTPGSVSVYVEAGTGTDPNGYPTTAQRNAVWDAINYDSDGRLTRRPVGATVNVYSILRQPFSVQIYGLYAPDLTATKALIDDAIEEYLLSLEPFIVGFSLLPRRDVVSSAALGGIINSVAVAQGGYFEYFFLRDGSSIVITTYSLDEGEKARLTGVTYHV